MSSMSTTTEQVLLNNQQPEPAHDPLNRENPGIVETRQKPRVLFICTHNSARSQMAEGYLRARYGNLFEATSAGTDVRGVHPLSIAVMAEIGIDISGHRSKLVDEYYHTRIDIVVKVCDCADKACPFFPGVHETIHAPFPDPSDCTGPASECIARFHEVRDAIIDWIDTSFIPEYGHSVMKPQPISLTR